MKQLRVLLASLAAVLALATPPANAFPNEPSGFRGIAWGAPITQYASQMVETEGDGVDASYHRFGDSLNLGTAHLAGITYNFYKGAFIGVVLHSDTGDARDAMLTEFQSRFGQAVQPKPAQELYTWRGPTAVIVMDCSKSKDQCAAEIYSRAILNLRDADRNATATATPPGSF
jgi:hypothetical protein